jgi:HTH-type transcriptional regulator / antitoxin HigA
MCSSFSKEKIMNDTDLRIVHPGLHVSAWLRNNRMTQAQLAAALGYQEPFVSKIVHGKAHISPIVAVKLETVTHVSAATWIGYEVDRQLARARALL